LKQSAETEGRRSNSVRMKLYGAYDSARLLNIHVMHNLCLTCIHVILVLTVGLGFVCVEMHSLLTKKNRKFV